MNIPKGYQLAPIEPTAEMINAGQDQEFTVDVYSAMLASAQTPPQPIYDEAVNAALLGAQNMNAAMETIDMLRSQLAERDAMLTAADERADVLKGLLRSLPEDFKELSGCENTAGVYACIDYIEQLVVSLKPAEAAKEEHACTGCGSKGWTANCKECVPY